MIAREFPSLAGATLLCLAFTSIAGNFGVAPIRLDLDRGAKTGSITVTNNDEEKLQVQMRAFAWRQDENGKDVYEESNDLIFFPKLMLLSKEEARVIRAGYKVPATNQEKSYRLFIEEIPTPEAGSKPGGQVSVAIRFGVPVFLHPVEEKAGGEIDMLDLRHGKLEVGVRNTGNAHFIINAIEVRSASGFSSSTKGWYLLAGAKRKHAIEVPADLCAQAEKLDIAIKTDKTEFSRTLDLKTSCTR